MDSERFDDIVQTLSAAGSRRGLLRILAVVPLLGLLTVRRGPAPTAARGRRTKHPPHAQAHRHSTNARSDVQRQHHAQHHTNQDAHSEACLASGQHCPKKKHGKHGKKLSCAQCCGGVSHLDPAGKRVCGCQPDGATCQAATCSAAAPCPTCQTCTGGVCVPIADGTVCDDGNACTQTAACQAGVCVGSDPVACNNLLRICHTSSNATCDPTTGCVFTALPNGSTCEDGVCCNGTCCSGCCGADGSCGACLAFVTSTTHDGNLGGLAGADAICQARATAALLPGTYKAWLSTGNGANESPVNGRFRQSGLPYRLPDTGNTKIADDWTDLTTCENGVSGACLDHAIDVTESGGTLSSDFVWSNTGSNGNEAPAQFDCDNWTSADGGNSGDWGQMQNNVVTGGWTDGGSISCAELYRLYCFQQI